MSAPGGEERIVRRRRSVVVQPDDHTGEVRVVRSGPAELIVGDDVAEPGQGGARREVLELPAPADVAEQDVELSVRPEADHAAVVIATRRLHLVRSGRSATSMRRSGTSAA